MADALSRRSYVDSECLVISSASPIWLEQVAASYAGDVQAQGMIAKLALDPSSVPGFTWRDGLLRYKNRIWIGQDESLYSKLVTAMHSSDLDRHEEVCAAVCAVLFDLSAGKT